LYSTEHSKKGKGLFGIVFMDQFYIFNFVDIKQDEG